MDTSVENEFSLTSSENTPTSTPTQTADSIGAVETTDKAPLLDRLKQRTASLFESGGAVFKKGRGRPRSDGSPKASDVPVNVPATALPLGAKDPNPAVSEAVDAETVQKVIRAVLKAFKGPADKWLFKTRIARGDTAKEAQQIVADTTITEDECDSFTKLSEICLRKYGVGTEYCPEIGIVAIFAGVGMRYKIAASAGEKKTETPQS